MQNSDKSLEKAAVTLEKYRKNRTRLSPEDLAGKYKKPFERLKQQLKEDLEAYLKAYILDGMTIRDDDEGWKVIADINQAFKDTQFGRQVGRAAFQEFNLQKIQQIAQEQRQNIYEKIYKPYFNRCIRKE